MAITQAIANSFKKELFDGDHDFSQSGGDVFKIALYTSSATLNSTTTANPDRDWETVCYRLCYCHVLSP